MNQAGQIPRHVAIIMDGNGRWAKARGKPRAFGHQQGLEALRRTVDAANKLGIEHLTVFSFSTENWSRPADEIDALFGLLRLYVHRDLKRLHKAGVKIRIFGSRERLKDDLIALITECEEVTANNTAFNLNIAFNYGGRAELVDAVRSIAAAAESGKLSIDQIDENLIRNNLWSSELPDADILLRTSGEQRISNFLLWNIAYSELIFLDVLWPDFDRRDLEQAIDTFRARDRRYGGLASS